VDECRIDDGVRIETPDARADLRRWRERGAREQRRIGREHSHRFSRCRIAFDRVDRTGKDPRMSLPQ
jgi:hypothetical protein